MERGKTEDEKLQMFFDGELAPEEDAAVRRSLEGSPDGAAQLREWEQLRHAMQSVSADWAGELDSDALFARIESEISAPVVPIEPSRQEPPAKQEPPALRVVPGGRERRVWGGVATGFAAAAAIFLAVMAWPESHLDPLPITRGSEVLEADFGSSTGTIFEVEGGAGETLAVVWIDDEKVGLP
jgi:anti-sigma factor RsiW